MGPAVKQIAIRAAWALVSLLLCPWSLPAANIRCVPERRNYSSRSFVQAGRNGTVPRSCL